MSKFDEYALEGKVERKIKVKIFQDHATKTAAKVK